LPPMTAIEHLYYASNIVLFEKEYAQL
jgi:hypothetical protein